MTTSGSLVLAFVGAVIATAAATTLAPPVAAQAADKPPAGRSYWIYGGKNVNGGAMLVQRRGPRISFSSVQGYHGQCFSGVQRPNGLVVGKTLDLPPEPFKTTFRVQRSKSRMKFLYTGAQTAGATWKRVGRTQANAHRGTNLTREFKACRRQPWFSK